MAIAKTGSGSTARAGLTGMMNGAGHLRALTAFLIMVGAHWAEHGVQAFQIYVLEMPRPQANGLLGAFWPFLVKSELLHWGYAALMLAGLVLMRHGFAGRARWWWNLALGIQVWHFFEHLLLLVQAWTGANLLGRPVPTSVIQLVLPRVELHLIYNMIVLIPVLAAVAVHWFNPGAGEVRDSRDACTCAARFAVPDRPVSGPRR